jgi:hypothetical protein
MGILNQVRLGHLSKLGVVLAAAALLVSLAWGFGSGGASAEGTGPRLAMSASGTGVSCDDATEATECTVPLSGAFTLSVNMIDPPSGGYIGLSTQMSLGGLRWTPAATADENTWPDNTLPVRSPDPPVATAQVLSHGGLTGTTPPFETSDYEGPVVQVTLNCSADANTFEVALINFDPAVTPLGTQYTLPDMTPVASKDDGERDVDLLGDGNIVTVPITSALDINCEEVPTPTVPAAPVPTATVGGLPSTGTGGSSPSSTPWPVLGLVAAATVLGAAGWRLRRGSAK